MNKLVLLTLMLCGIHAASAARSFNPEGSQPMGVIIGCVLGALILILILILILALAVIGVVIWKKRSSGYGKTSTSDTDSENSDQPAVKA